MGFEQNQKRDWPFSILDQTIGITKLRGIWHLYKDKNIEIPAFPVFHPAYLLRRPANKAFTMTDMLNFKNKIIEMKIDIKAWMIK